MTSLIHRTVVTPKEYIGETSGRTKQLNSLYIGFVKEVNDLQLNGRLRVWIPELSSDPTDSSGWFTVSYASPFAGATPWNKETNDPSYAGSQKSYGMWMIPPDLEVQVIVGFINGEPARGVFFGCLWDQYMNHMVPGIPGNNSTIGPPVAEYNKKIAETQPGFDPINNNRPIYSSLNNALQTQGLINDPIRGVSDSGARRPTNMENVNGVNISGSVFGVLTPQGLQFVMDDNAQNSFIRLRTTNGTQILINDTNGNIYLITRSGNNWIELSANGQIDVYASSDINFNTTGSFNVTARQNINLTAQGSFNLQSYSSTNGFNLQTSGNFNLNSTGGKFILQTNTDIDLSSGQNTNIYSGGSRNDTSVGPINRKSNQSISDGGSSINVVSGGDLKLTASNTLHLYGNSILRNQDINSGANSGSGPSSIESTTATPPKIYNQPNGSGGTTQTTANSMPTHEPYYGHPTQNISSPEFGFASPTQAVSNNLGDGLATLSKVPPSTQNYPGVPLPGCDYALWIYQGTNGNNVPLYSRSTAPPNPYANSPIALSNGSVGPSELFNPVTSYQTMSLEVQTNLLQRNEGLGGSNGPGQPYRDGAGIPTIGYGHVLLGNENDGTIIINGITININQVSSNGSLIKTQNGRALTVQECSQLLSQDMPNYVSKVYNALLGIAYNNQPVQITQYQFDVLVDCCYNSGQGGLWNTGIDNNGRKISGQSNYRGIPWLLSQGRGSDIIKYITTNLIVDINGVVERGLVGRSNTRAAYWSALPPPVLYPSGGNVSVIA